MLLFGAVMARSGVWQDYQSLPTRTLHQQVDPHVGSETTTTITPCELSILSTTPLSPLLVHPHAGAIVLFILAEGETSCVSRRGFFPVLVSRSQEWEPFPLSFTFSTERNLVCFHSYLGFGVNLLSRTGFCIVVTHIASW